MPTITDARLWRAISERAAGHDYGPDCPAVEEAVADLCAKHSLSDDQRESLTGRGQRLWNERMTIWGPM